LSSQLLPESQPIVVGGVPEHFNLPWHLAIESDEFSAKGIELQFNEVPGGTGAMMKKLEAQELDVAIVLAEGGIAAILKGNPSRAVKTYVQSPLIWGIHVSAKHELQSIGQIRDQRYAISRFGSGSHLMAIVDAAERGWDPDEMKFERVGNLDGARQALASGTAESFFWEKFTTAPFVQSGEFRRIGERRTLWPAFIICVRNDVLESQSKKIKSILSIINQRCENLMANENACQIISDRYKLRLPDVERWFEQTTWNTGFDKPATALDNIKAYLLKLDLVSQEQADSVVPWKSLDD
jgi:sulfonate transport system substrate-binding protein